MSHRRHSMITASVAAFLIILGLIGVYGQRGSTIHRLRFGAADGSVTPLFVVLTRGQLETHYDSRRRPRVELTHRFDLRDDRWQPVSALDYWVRERTSKALYPLGFRGITPRIIAVTPTTTDTSLLWFGYRGTNSVYPEGAVLLSDRGLRMPLLPRLESMLGDRPPPALLVCWELPSLLTNRGNYRLAVPSLNLTMATFDYE